MNHSQKTIKSQHTGEYCRARQQRLHVKTIKNLTYLDEQTICINLLVLPTFLCLKKQQS